MSDSYVCSGAMMRCTMGTSPATLTVLPVRTVFLTGQPQANISDHKSMVNLAPFGLCRSLGFPATASATAAALGTLTPMPCMHNTPAPWIGGKMDCLIKGQPALLKSSKCQCMWGGTISLVTDGQVGEGVQYVPKMQKDLSNNQQAQEEWLYTHQDELVNKYIDENQNKLDPDEVRKLFEPIGYTGLNVEKFRIVEKKLTRIIRDTLCKKAIADGNRSITLLTGIPGAGKSTATKKIDLSKQGVVYDSAFNGYDSLKRAIVDAIKIGMKTIQIIAVHSDATTAFENTLKRAITTGRSIPLNYFINDAYPSNQSKIMELARESEQLMEKYPDLEIIIKCFDNSGNSGGKEVTLEDAKKWNYVVDFKLRKDLLHILKRYKSNPNMKKETFASICLGLNKVAQGTEQETMCLKEIIGHLLSD